MPKDIVANVETAIALFRSAEGEERSERLEYSLPALFDASPWRTFHWYRGQRNYSGWYWCATERDHVIYESLNELGALQLADFDVAVRRIIAQPFHLSVEVNGKLCEHTLDYLFDTDDGPIVVDVTTKERATHPRVSFLCEWTRQVLESVGWRYEVQIEPPPRLITNVRFLAGYRRDWLVNADALTQLRAHAVDLTGLRFDDAERQIAYVPPPFVRSALLHLLWRQEFSVDLTRPLGPATVLEAPP